MSTESGGGKAARTGGRFARAGVVLALGFGLPICVGNAVAIAATPSPAQAASGVGDEVVRWIDVSPAYTHTGTVIAMSAASGCSSDCIHLWSTHDGGATWSRLAAAGWQHGEPVIAATGNQETLFATGSDSLQRSDDGGASWHKAGPLGSPGVSPRYAQDGTVAVAGGSGSDYLYRRGSTSPITGSGGRYHDLGFTYAPGPSSGGHSPVLLSAADPKTGSPYVGQCSADLSCQTILPLPKPEPMSGGAFLYPSPAYAGDGTVFARIQTNLYKSVNGGTAFQPLAVGDPTAQATGFEGLALDPAYDDRGANRVAYTAIIQLFADPKHKPSGGVYRTSDGGTTWSQLAPGTSLDSGATALALAPGGRLFAGYMQNDGAHGGLLCWENGAWKAACTPVHLEAANPGQTGACSASSCSGPSGGQASPGTGVGDSGGVSGSGPVGTGAKVGGAGLDGASGGSGSGRGGSRVWVIPLLLVAAVLAVGAGVRSIVARRARA